MRRNRWMILMALAGLTAAAQPTAAGTPPEALHELLAEHWEHQLTERPLFATRAGDRRYNDRLAEVSPADYDRRLETEREFLARLRAIDRSALSGADRVNYDIFDPRLEPGGNAEESEGESPHDGPSIRVSGDEQDDVGIGRHLAELIGRRRWVGR